jgi:hypothetical protein
VLLTPAHVAVPIVAPFVIVLGVLAPPGGSLLGVAPSMPIVGAVPIAVGIAEGDAAARANINA